MRFKRIIPICFIFMISIIIGCFKTMEITYAIDQLPLPIVYEDNIGIADEIYPPGPEIEYIDNDPCIPTDSQIAVKWAGMEGYYNETEQVLNLCRGAIDLTVPLPFESGMPYQSYLFTDFSDIKDSNGRTIPRENIEKVNFINQIEIKNLKYRYKDGRIDDKNPSLNGMFAYGTSGPVGQPSVNKGFKNLKEVTGFDKLSSENNKPVNIDYMFTNSKVETVDLSKLTVPIEGNHSYYFSYDVAFVESFESAHIKTVILPPNIEKKDNEILNFYDSFNKNASSSLQLIQLPKGYEFNFYRDNKHFQLPSSRDQVWINGINSQQITKKNPIVDTRQSTTSYVNVYNKWEYTDNASCPSTPTDSQIAVKWAGMEGYYNETEQVLNLCRGAIDLTVPLPFESGMPYQSYLFTDFSDIKDSNGRTIPRENIEKVNFINQIEIKNLKYRYKDGRIDDKNPSLNGMFAYGTSGPVGQPSVNKGFKNLKEVTGFDKLSSENNKPVNIDNMFTNSMVETVDLSELKVTVQGNHSYYFNDGAFIDSFESEHIKTVILPPNIEKKNNEIITFYDSFNKNASSSLQLIQLPKDYEFNFSYRSQKSNIFQLPSSRDQVWINGVNSQQITKKNPIVDTRQSETSYVNVYNKNNREMLLKKDHVYIPDDMQQKDIPTYILEETQPDIVIGNNMSLASYEKEPDLFKVTEINNKQATICYNQNVLILKMCKEVKVTQDQLEDPLNIKVPDSLPFNEINIPVRTPGLSNRATEDWHIEVSGVENLDEIDVSVSQEKLFSSQESEIKEGLNLIYKSRHDSTIIGLDKDPKNISKQDFECNVENLTCITNWEQDDGILLQYTKNIDPMPVEKVEYSTQLLFTLSVAL